MIEINKLEIRKAKNNELAKVSSTSSRIKIMFFQKKYEKDAYEYFKDKLEGPTIYLLKGMDHHGNTCFYVGKTNNFFKRTSEGLNHHYNEEWIEKIILISSKD